MPAPLRQERHALIPRAGSRSRQVWEEQGPWRPVESRKCQGKAGQGQELNFEQVERDVAGAGMGPRHCQKLLQASAVGKVPWPGWEGRGREEFG